MAAGEGGKGDVGGNSTNGHSSGACYGQPDSLHLLGVSTRVLPTGAGQDGCLADHPQAWNWSIAQVRVQCLHRSCSAVALLPPGFKQVFCRGEHLVH